MTHRLRTACLKILQQLIYPSVYPIGILLLLIAENKNTKDLVKYFRTVHMAQRIKSVLYNEHQSSDPRTYIKAVHCDPRTSKHDAEMESLEEVGYLA